MGSDAIVLKKQPETLVVMQWGQKKLLGNRRQQPIDRNSMYLHRYWYLPAAQAS